MIVTSRINRTSPLFTWTCAFAYSRETITLRNETPTDITVASTIALLSRHTSLLCHPLTKEEEEEGITKTTTHHPCAAAIVGVDG